VTTDKPAYRNGDAVVCTIVPPFDGYLRVYSIDARQNRVRIFPNHFEKNDQVRGGQAVQVPGIDSYDLTLQLPPGATNGSELVQAVVSPLPFHDEPPGNDPKNPYQDLGAGNPSELPTRGLQPKQKASVGETIYIVNP